MNTDTSQLVVFAAAAALRLALFTAFPLLSSILGGRVEISTPVTSFKRLQEGLFLYTHDVSPYDGGIFHQAPLLLPLMALLPDYQSFPLVTHLVYIAMDLLSAQALLVLAKSGESIRTRLFTSPRMQMTWTPAAVAAAYLFNPFTIATCIGQSSSIFVTCSILQAVAATVSGNVVRSVLALGLASYLSLYPILLAPPLALLAFDKISQLALNPPQPLRFFVQYSIGLAMVIAGLLKLSYNLTGNSWLFISSTYGVQLTLSDLTPNIGLWWYFFIEMFDSFRDFFLGVFWLHMTSYVAGLTIRLRRQPLFVVTSMLGIFAVFKPYPSIADAALFLAMVPLYRHVFPLLRYSFIEVTALTYATFLGPAFYYVWIYVGSGNANFFYAITLVWSLGLILFESDLLYAVLRDEFEQERPEMKGKEVSQI